MNPYLEQADVWNDFHQSFIPQAREVLGEQVRPAYFVKVEEQLFIHEATAPERQFVGRADVSVAKGPEGLPSAPAMAVLQAPAYGRVSVVADIERHAYLEIRDRQNRELVTVLELLSPANKYQGPDRETYLSKRRQLLRSAVHLVEIDLLRGGPRLPVEDLPDCDYCVIVSRWQERPRVGIWPIRLRERLPVIPIPLRAPHPDARLDLQELLNRVYDGAGYGDYIYTGTPQPRLHPDDDVWARQLISPPRA
jgi:hypothetical protein